MKMIAIKSDIHKRREEFTEGRVVTVIEERACKKCRQSYYFLEEFPFYSLVVAEIHCEKCREITEVRTKFRCIPKDYLAPIDDEETRKAFEKLQEKDKQTDKRKEKIK